VHVQEIGDVGSEQNSDSNINHLQVSVGGDGLEVSGLGLDIIDGGPFEVGDDEMESFFEDVIFQASKSAENNSLMTRFNCEDRLGTQEEEGTSKDTETGEIFDKMSHF